MRKCSELRKFKKFISRDAHGGTGRVMANRETGRRRWSTKTSQRPVMRQRTQSSSSTVMLASSALRTLRQRRRDERCRRRCHRLPNRKSRPSLSLLPDEPCRHEVRRSIRRCNNTSQKPALTSLCSESELQTPMRRLEGMLRTVGGYDVILISHDWILCLVPLFSGRWGNCPEFCQKI